MIQARHLAITAAYTIALGLIVLLFYLWHQDLHWFAIMFIGLTALIIYDRYQTQHAILRNFPIIGHLRFLMEMIRPEIHQYFIASDLDEKPFNRKTRALIYQRAKQQTDTIPFGSDQDLLAPGYEWVLHSLKPCPIDQINARITIGNQQCQKPYSASRLNISAMSFGALSAPAIIALNQGAKLSGCYHNTGEGSISDYHLQGGDLVWQIGTGYFGTRDANGKFDPKKFEDQAADPVIKMIEIKLSQGAKPAHGGILPKEKITPEIAKIRHIPLDQDVLSPPAHTTFNSPTSLLEWLSSCRNLAGGKPIGFKLCLGKPTEFLGIVKAMLATEIYPDFITIDGAEGGTGAAPVEFTNRVGTPLNDALLLIHNALIGAGIREHIKLIVSGKIVTGFDMTCKIALGADICQSARAMMMALGCIQSKQCNLNTCPTGIATQNKRLQYGLVPEAKKHRVFYYHQATIHNFLSIVGAIGLSDPSDLKPQHIMRRMATNQISDYQHQFENLNPQSLLDRQAPKSWLNLWDQASADKFC
jgi:glutamate synthase domain-containing protein 2